MFTCLQSWRQYTASEGTLAPQGGFDWSETDRSEALANITLIKVDVGHRGLERLNKQPRDRLKTINICNCSLNLQSILYSCSRLMLMSPCAYHITSAHMCLSFCNVCACVYIYMSVCTCLRQGFACTRRSTSQTHTLNI